MQYRELYFPSMIGTKKLLFLINKLHQRKTACNMCSTVGSIGYLLFILRIQMKKGQY